jgi:carbonic anhydrase
VSLARLHPGSHWKSDGPAAVVIFLIAVPLCLGIALASGAPLMSGIVAGVMGGLVAGTLSGSSLMISGPAAGLTVIVASGIQQAGSFEAFLTAVVLAGVIQVALGGIRAGFFGYYVPTAVIRGMVAAIGLILILKQIPHALGYDADAMGDEAFRQANSENTFSAILHALREPMWGAIIIAGISLALLVVWRRTALRKVRYLPAPLVVVVVGIIINALFAQFAPHLALSASHLVNLPSFISGESFFSQLALPDFGVLFSRTTWQLAALLAVVASLESLLSLEATDRLDPYKREVSADRELVAQGFANVASGLFGGLPVAGVVVRSAANVEAGAISRGSAILHAVMILVMVLLMPHVLNLIPLACIAAILLHLGFSLASPRVAREELALGRAHAVPFAATVVAIVLTDLLIGILIGLAFGVYYILRDHLKTPPFTEVSGKGAVLRRLKLHDNLNFLHRGAFIELLQSVPDGSRLELDARDTRRIDPDVLEVLVNFRATAQLRDIDFRLVGIPEEAPLPAPRT